MGKQKHSPRLIMEKKLIAAFIIVTILITMFSGCLEEEKEPNQLPSITISYPSNRATVLGLVMISGTATDPDGDENIETVEIKIGNHSWETADGTTKWSYDWTTYDFDDNSYTISVRSSDGNDYSEIKTITVTVDNPKSVESDSHKWAIFIAAANFPEDNESKLGNGGLYLAEEMAAYLIEKGGYATSNIVLLFDDGWIRSDNGFGEKIMTLQQRTHDYDIIYGGATQENVENSLNHLITEANKYRDSEVFIWVFNHGYGDVNDSLTGGKLLESSQIFLWDDILSDKDLGDM